MAQVIASTYELLKQIGAGGGGVVYLAEHLRLSKQVVLKADKRKTTTDPELLRREVDVLKDLSHPYIPQVYDYFLENDTVYTVIDFIDGESLDKPLKAQIRFPQSQVVGWAIELLEALVYLHDPIHGNPPRGYVHSDIKPANIMLRPNGDICLIDFNIALAIGEVNVVGASAGYASPEHYGLDYSSHGLGVSEDSIPMPGDPTVTLPMTGQKQSVERKRRIVPDERSDIYSLGATLYHVLTGKRPAKYARDVVPLTSADVSEPVATIVNKAMNPNPDLRYQTAAEMLWDFEHLHENDPRAKHFRRTTRIAAGSLAALFLLGGALTLAGSQQNAKAAAEAEAIALAAEDEARKAQMEERAAKETEMRANHALELIGSSQEMWNAGNADAATRNAMEALSLDTVYNTQAQKALTEALGVYDLSDGFKAKRAVELPSETLALTLSPDGTRVCAICAWEMTVFDTESGERLVSLPVEQSALAEAEFLDEDRVIYAGPGAVCAYDLGAGRQLWSGEPATGIAVSADGRYAAAVNKNDAQARVYDAATGELLKTVSFGGHQQKVLFNDTFADPHDNLFALNADGSMLAVSFDGGGLYVYDLVADDDIEIFDNSDYTHFEGGFFGKYLAVSMISGDKSLFALLNMEELSFIGSIPGTARFRLQVDESGIYLARDNLLVKFDPETLTDRELAFTLDRNIVAFRHAGDYTIVATDDKSFAVFGRGARELATDRVTAEYSCDFVDLAGGVAAVGSMDSPSLRLLRLENHADAEIFSYDPAYLHSEARISADRETVMLFRHDRFRVYTMNGEIACDAELPDAESVYDQQFRREGGESRLEVMWYDGTIRCYSARDGALLSEERGAPPDTSLYEEFLTERYRITGPLHGTPEVYDRETGEFIRLLEPDAYLTYVTETGGYIVMEYVAAQTGERYGLLLDEMLETLARLPNLCDIYDDTLVFDYPSGNLRESRIYSAQELLALANKTK